MLETVIYKTSKLVMLILFLSAVMLPKAEAHRVTVFAWVEGDMIHTQSKFGGGRKAQKAPIRVYDQHDNLLLEGKTDNQGQFRFKAPGKIEMKVVLAAGDGHRAEWIVRAAEFGKSDHDSPASIRSPATNAGHTAETASKPASAETVTDISAAELQQLVETAIDKKLQPVIRMLVKKNTAGPTFKDIMGGIGYIFGLVGIATYFRCRNKSA